MPWPSYPLYPLMAAHAGATPGPGRATRPLADAVNDRHQARSSSATPTTRPGRTYSSAELGSLLVVAPRASVHVLLDEALVHFQDAEDVDACLRLVDAFPRLLVVRTFSKIYGLSGLRAGYAVGSDARLLAAIAPVLGVNALTQAAVEYALRNGDGEIERRRQAVARERKVLTEQLRELGVDVTDSQANFLWIRVRDMSGDQLAERPAQAGRDSRPRRPARRGPPHPRRRPRTRQPRTACCRRFGTNYSGEGGGGPRQPPSMPSFAGGEGAPRR